MNSTSFSNDNFKIFMMPGWCKRILLRNGVNNDHLFDPVLLKKYLSWHDLFSIQMLNDQIRLSQSTCMKTVDSRLKDLVDEIPLQDQLEYVKDRFNEMRSGRISGSGDEQYTLEMMGSNTVLVTINDLPVRTDRNNNNGAIDFNFHEHTMLKGLADLFCRYCSFETMTKQPLWAAYVVHLGLRSQVS